MKTGSILSAAAAAIGLAFSASAPAQPVSKAAYEAARKDIASDYKTAKIGCEPMEGDVRDLCLADVKGRHEVALAELEVAHTPSAKTRDELRIARARTDYVVAERNCEGKAGKAKDVCLTEAKSRYGGS